MSRQEFPRQAAGRLGDDLQRSRYSIDRPPVTFELLKSESGDEFARELTIFPNIE